MGVYDFVNYVIYDNPLSKSVQNLVVKEKNVVMPPIPVTVVSETKPLWKLAADGGPLIRVAGVMGATAVALGAYGAHRSYPKDRADELRPVFETGNRYHFFHSLALFGVPFSRNPRLSCTLIVAGTTLFSGACYYHAFTGDDRFRRFAPVGGTLLIIGWLTFIL